MVERDSHIIRVVEGGKTVTGPGSEARTRE
jgi:hypothetical protein